MFYWSSIEYFSYYVTNILHYYINLCIESCSPFLKLSFAFFFSMSIVCATNRNTDVSQRIRYSIMDVVTTYYKQNVVVLVCTNILWTLLVFHTSSLGRTNKSTKIQLIRKRHFLHHIMTTLWNKEGVKWNNVSS